MNSLETSTGQSQKFKRVYVVDDVSPEMQEKIKERAVNAFAQSKGIDSKIKGQKIVVDVKAYSHKEM